jgi:hypothetical protein
MRDGPEAGLAHIDAVLEHGKDLGTPTAGTGLQQDCSPPGFGSIHTHNFSAAGRVGLDCAQGAPTAYAKPLVAPPRLSFASD